MIRIGFGVYYTKIIIRSPQNPILIIKAPTLPHEPSVEARPVRMLTAASGGSPGVFSITTYRGSGGSLLLHAIGFRVVRASP